MSTRPIFGLGEWDDTVDAVQVEWGSGLVQHAFYVDVNQTLAIVETDQASAADYSGNGIVDAADFVIWRDLLGSSSSLADGDGNGMVGMEDYYLWRAQFGRVVGATVPEPNGFVWLVFGVFGWRKTYENISKIS